MIQFDEHIFSNRWFNHQLVFVGTFQNEDEPNPGQNGIQKHCKKAQVLVPNFSMNKHPVFAHTTKNMYHPDRLSQIIYRALQLHGVIISITNIYTHQTRAIIILYPSHIYGIRQ